MKNIIFIAKVSKPDKEISSADIMTNNVILGLKQNGINLTLIIVCDDNRSKGDIMNYYSKFANKIIFVPSFFTGEQNKYLYVYRMFKYIFSSQKYHKIIKKETIKYPDIIIANKISSDELFYGWSIKKMFSKALFYQYWTDPFTLNGIDIEKYKCLFSRHIFRPIENRLLKMADKAIYGTKILMDVQKEFFPKYQHKMSYVDIAFVPNYVKNNIPKKKYSLLYAGNFYSTTRNIKPLLNAIEEQDKYSIDIYGNGDIRIKTTDKIHYKERIAYDELQSFQDKYECRICILNNSTFQIPGKIFYDIMCDANILVIADGKYTAQIIDYLKKYKRYTICNNNKEEILNALAHMNNQTVDYQYIESNYSPLKISQDILNGGK